MPGVNDRNGRQTVPFDMQKVLKESEAAEDDVEIARAEPPPVHPHVVPGAGRLASGTTPPQGTTRPVAVVIDAEPPPEPRSRTTTMHDPMTTSVLAEVARRTKTIETEPLPSDFTEEDTRPTGIRRGQGKREG